MIGGLYAAGAGAAVDYNVKRRKIDSQTLSDLSHSDLKSAINALTSATEYGENRRAKDYRVRLHPAKYLKTDPLFKDLFFPLLNYARSFGFCSTTGAGADTAAMVPGGLNPDNETTFTKANGVYRGLSLFTVRSNVMDSDDDYKLNAKSVQVGWTELTGTDKYLMSPYRRFNNGPPLRNQGATGATVTGDDSSSPWTPKAQTLTWGPFTESSASFNKTNLSISEVGNLISDIETGAVHSTNFASSIGSGSHNEGTSATATHYDQSGAGNWDGTTDIITNGNYRPNFRNTTMRIADGKLVLDITNGKNSSCLIEVVIQSQKKLESSWTPQKYFDEVYQAVQFQQNQTRDPMPSPVLDNLYESSPGGWQAFYDPEYPLLHVKSAHAKKVKDMVNEVHRSAHMLAPGQSKKITVDLGSLYYQLGNKTNNSSNTRMQPPAPNFGVGSLIVAVGHSGVSQLSMPTPNTSVANGTNFNVFPNGVTVVNGERVHTVPGAGFWVGKQKAPSEIVVQGHYSEKYYPAYVVSDQRNQYDDYVMLPPFAQVSAGDYSFYTMPSGLPVQETIGTVDATHQSIAAKVSSSEKGPF